MVGVNRTFSTVLVSFGMLLLLFFFILLLAVVPAHGQQYAATYPAFEGFIGFSANNNQFGDDRHNSFGVQGSGSYNPHRAIRAVADFGFHYHGSDIRWSYNNREAHLNEYQFLIGPEFVLRNKSRATPFVRGMAGFAGRRYAVPTGYVTCDYGGCHSEDFNLASDFGFAASVGGGLDVDINQLCALRVVQFDYIRTHLSRNTVNWPDVEGQLPIVTGWQNNYRFAFGIVLRLGERGNGR